MKEKGNLIQCQECGRWFKSLNAHVKIHDISVKEYKDKYNIKYSESLEVESTTKLRSEATKEQIEIGNIKVFEKKDKRIKSRSKNWKMSQRGREELSKACKKRFKDKEYKDKIMKNFATSWDRGEDQEKREMFNKLIEEFNNSNFVMVSKFLKSKNIKSNSFYVYAKRHNITIKEVIK